MSYSLQDPYRYTPKCFPFLSTSRPYGTQYTSSRLTQKNRQIEGSLTLLKHQYMSQIHKENQNSQINMLKIRQMVKGLKGGRNEQHQEIKCQLYGARRNKENNLRRCSHKFPEFVKYKELLLQKTAVDPDHSF